MRPPARPSTRSNPANDELLARIADGDKEDVNRAVAAARRAFEGPWRKVKPRERQLILLKLADLVEKNAGELAILDVLGMGAPGSWRWKPGCQKAY